MNKDVSLSLRIDQKLSTRLQRSAKFARCSKSALAAFAIRQYLDDEDRELALTRKALAEAKANGPYIPHADVVKWLNSWGTKNELPPPKPRRSRA